MEEAQPEVKETSHCIYTIAQKEGMHVPSVIFSSPKLLEKVKQDKTLQQLQNMAHLPGIVKNAIAMPDAHQGYGFCIGGVAAFDMKKGIISPGGVGYDINCGVRLLRTDFTIAELMPRREALLEVLFKNVPSGVGKAGSTKLDDATLKDILKRGAEWAVEKGYGTSEDLQRTEEYGRAQGADPSVISTKAMKRGKPQLGTLGSGNHFLEIQKIDKIYDKEVAEKFGITKEGQIVVMIHTGSRGLGHQIASDFIKEMEQKYGFANLPDRELINAPINSEEGERYLKAMWCAMNFAFANRQMITHWTRKSFEQVLGSSKGIELVYDVCHNIAKIEEHVVDGESQKVCVHRKGATRSFGPGRPEIPSVYREVGQPVLIPGSMGTASYVLVGTKKAEEISFGSTAHGAGRAMSRSQAKRDYTSNQVIESLKEKGILVKGASQRGIVEEAPGAYKDVDEVIKVSHEAGIGKMVARMVPVAVMKG